MRLHDDAETIDGNRSRQCNGDMWLRILESTP